MNISKLTITPVIKGASKVVISEPNEQRAGMLIMEKLRTNHDKPEKIKLKKLPKFLLGFINPETRVRQLLNTVMK